jgi:DNA-binding response OmpR family regulator
MLDLDNICDAGGADRVLVVDDDPAIRALHRGLLAKQFDVITAESGEKALEICRQTGPDLILLDIDMPGLDGIETCRRLREWADIPVIFATAHENLDVHMQAYDAGGDDIITKPVHSEILLRKAAAAIQMRRKLLSLAEEKASMQQMAMSFLSSMGQNGILLNFIRASVTCRDHKTLARKLLEAASELGGQCSVMIRHPEGMTFLTADGEPTDLERAILEKSAEMGRLFQFKRRLVVNYDHVSLLVANMPEEGEDPEQAGRLRDNIAILAETVEGLVDIVDTRIESMRRADQLQTGLSAAESVIESLRDRYRIALNDTHVLLLQLVSEVEQTYSWLGINQEQEEAISKAMDGSVQRIIALLTEQNDFEEQFQDVIRTLRGSRSQSDIELF